MRNVSFAQKLFLVAFSEKGARSFSAAFSKAANAMCILFSIRKVKQKSPCQQTKSVVDLRHEGQTLDTNKLFHNAYRNRCARFV